MLVIVAVGVLGFFILLMGLSLLLRKPIGGSIPPRGPPLVMIAVGVVLVGLGLWGNKNPKRFERALRPGSDNACPLILSHVELFQLTQEKATAFTGRRVEGGWCDYDFELRSGRKFKGKVNLDLEARQDEWNQTCGVHPLTQGAAEVWLRRTPEDEQLLCFITKRFQGAIWLDKEADGLTWQRVLQQRLPYVFD